MSYCVNVQKLIYLITQAGNKLTQHVSYAFACLCGIDFQLDVLVPCQVKIHPHCLAFIREGSEGCCFFLVARTSGRKSRFSLTHTHLLLKNLMEYFLNFLHQCTYFFRCFTVWLHV